MAGLDWERLAKAGMGRPTKELQTLVCGRLAMEREAKEKGYAPLSPEEHAYEAQISAALWRDRAVRFLVLNERTWSIGVSGQPGDFDVTLCRYTDADTEEKMSKPYAASTLDAALYAAVEAVLKQEGKL